jgi:mannose-6-phosphate isomerase-like protein (cupin superfamily)
MEVINIKNKLEKFHEHFSPQIIAELNGQHVKLVKFKGEFVWHSHKDEDELFYVIKGSFYMDLRDRTLEIKEGEMIVILKGTEHRPRAEEEVHIMLFEPVGTINTGDTESVFTRNELDWI